MSKVLEISNLHKSFGKQHLFSLQKIFLQLHEGEIITLLGPSGCGKTTLLRLIAGLELPNSGQIILNGKEVNGSKTYISPHKRKIGMVFQDYALFPHLTVSKNILFGTKKDTSIFKKDKLNQILDLIGMHQQKDQFPHQLSGGQQQRVALGRALAQDPDILLLDEPFSNIDQSLKGKIRKEVLYILKKSKKAAIFVSHDIDDAMHISDRIVLMNNGKIEQIGTPKELYETPNTIFTAQFMGHTNMMEADIEEQSVQTNIGCIVQKHRKCSDRNCILTFRPEDAKLDKEGNYFGEVVSSSYCGRHQLVVIRCKGKHECYLTICADSNCIVSSGEIVRFSINENHLNYIPKRKETFLTTHQENPLH